SLPNFAALALSQSVRMRPVIVPKSQFIQQYRVGTRCCKYGKTLACSSKYTLSANRKISQTGFSRLP
ncbi:MAG: hypothetical protein KDA43_05930, partial [Hyphomonas sp.]|nr:hypothetical protein [Hyphomonas sp.]